MAKKVLVLDGLSIESIIQVGSHKYAKLFKQNGYKVFSLSHAINAYRLLRQNYEDKELTRSWRSGIRESKEGVYFYAPFCFLPYVNLPLLNTLNVGHNCLRFCIPSLRKILHEIDFINIDLLFINDITSISVLKFVKPKITVFRIADRMEAFKNVPSTISTLREGIINISDLVFATSRNLALEASAINKNTFHLPNGVDEGFVGSINEEFLLPDEYKEIKKPIVVYIGAISDWFDYDIYEYGLAKRGNISFVMIGPISGVNHRNNVAKIKHFAESYQNFHYLGVLPHSEIKKYMVYANVGIIPFKLNSLTNEINPVKFFEYAGSGLPTIASYMTELRNYGEYISFYKSKEEYVNLLLNYFDKKIPQSQKMIEFARNNTWESRFRFMLSQIEKKSHEKELD